MPFENLFKTLCSYLKASFPALGSPIQMLCQVLIKWLHVMLGVTRHAMHWHELYEMPLKEAGTMADSASSGQAGLAGWQGGGLLGRGVGAAQGVHTSCHAIHRFHAAT